ncbi:MAG: spore germination protein [Lachnospiraceae bacterium]
MRSLQRNLSEGIRLVKYAMLFLCAGLGIMGFFLGLVFLLVHLANLKSFGVSYLAPYSAWELNQGADRKDSLLRFPLIFLKRRPVFARAAGGCGPGRGVRVFAENGKISPRQLRCPLTLDFSERSPASSGSCGRADQPGIYQLPAHRFSAGVRLRETGGADRKRLRREL